MMRLVAVSIVKNEADIIEAFVRHTQTWVDHHLVFDHASTDGTREILAALKAEGLALSLFTDDARANLQQLRSAHLSQIAARDHDADWILPLDADEILCGPGRAALEVVLAASVAGVPRSLPLINYYPTERDDLNEVNPVRRLRYSQPTASSTNKLIIPRSLIVDQTVTVGKGSHSLGRSNVPVPDQPLPGDYFHAHLALRSPQHQVMRVVLAELQKLSAGKSHAGLDEHYRLGFQLLAEAPDRFFAAINGPIESYALRPISYQGGALKYTAANAGWGRVSRALLPFLEELAKSHGRLVDELAQAPAATPTAPPVIRELHAGAGVGAAAEAARPQFFGFTPRTGWGPPEGPVPEAFLPPFHWSYGPTMELELTRDAAAVAELEVEWLTYSPGQKARIELNGTTVAEHTFARINQKDSVRAQLNLQPGPNLLAFHFSEALVTWHDARRLAALFLCLRVSGA